MSAAEAPRRDSILRVDLTAGTVARERVPERWRRRFLGGKGLGARYLYEELDASADPLGPENRLLFALGPLSGYLPGETRYAAVTKSPLTGAFLDSYAGGEFPATLSGALPRCLAVLVKGAAAEPTALHVADGDAELRPTDAWGLDTAETDAAFPGAAVACVGPAGEREVRTATIASDGGDHHAGRGGAGAVMGSKRLKAVVVRGEAPDPPPALAELRDRDETTYAAADTGRWLAASDTVETVDFLNEVGALATEGWRGGRFEGTDDVGVAAVKEAAVGRERPESAVPGGFRVETDAGDHVARGATAMSLGAGLGIDDFDAVAALGATCDRLGVDLIAAGNAVAWTVLAAEADALPETAELPSGAEEPAFGDPDAARALVEGIARRDGPVADALAEGVAAGARRLVTEADGRDANGDDETGEADDATTAVDDFVPAVKAMSLPAYDPRGAEGMALAYATSDRGGCHRRARPVEDGAFADRSQTETVRAVVGAQTARSVLWSLVVDDFVGEALRADLGTEWLRALGFDHDRESLVRAGERIWTLVRLFNAREGFDRDDDALPPRLTDPDADGRALDPEAFDRTLSAYYDARDWGQDGLPTAATLSRLDLAAVRDDETPVSDRPAADRASESVGPGGVPPADPD
ncbi:MAG: aldehyde ferredoxin oxidoreductase family protein [Halolamina sp.]